MFAFEPEEQVKELLLKIGFKGFLKSKRNDGFIGEKLLLHVCCAPCATYTILKLKYFYGFKITAYYFNPNIHPETEYRKRLNEVERLSNFFNIKFIVGEYSPREWFLKTKKLKDEPEGGRRCGICYGMRLSNTAKKATEMKIKYFSSTLTISPHINVKRVLEIGKRLEKIYGLEYIDDIFRKDNGCLYSIKMSKALDFYRQDYCGCEYSFIERRIIKK